MIVHNVTQGSAEWSVLRMGKPTASQFHRVWQPHRKKPSRQRDLYLLELVDEFLVGKQESFSNVWTRRGQELEPLARFSYTMETGSAVQEVGFVTRDDGLVGGSPDGLVSNDTVLEIKIASPQIHTKLNENASARHIAQIQGLLYITEREHAHLWHYSDTSESKLTTIDRDEDWISEFVPVLDQFLEELDDAKNEVAGAYYGRTG